jgi:hypothetical protein
MFVSTIRYHDLWFILMIKQVVRNVTIMLYRIKLNYYARILLRNRCYDLFFISETDIASEITFAANDQ